MNNCFSKTIDSCFKELSSSPNGLSKEEAFLREGRYKSERLETPKKEGFIKKFFKQFADLMIIILLLAATVSLIIGLISSSTSELFDALIIMAIVFMNAMFGAIQENKAEKSIEALQQMTRPEARVLRGGEQQTIPADKLVPGDVVLLEAGSIVPADCRLIESAALQVNEASLTGESLPVEKNAGIICKENAALAERKNMVYSGTTVVCGRGQGVVTAVGKSSEIGKIASVIASTEKEMTPLQKGIKDLGKVITYLILGIALVTFILELAARTSPLEAFLTSVAIAVAAIPESMPAVITIIMSLGISRLAKRKAIVKHMHSVETLGSCDVICSDKTGTITQNKMMVKAVYCDGKLSYSRSMLGVDFELLLAGMALCNDTRKSKHSFQGDPTEIALAEFVSKYDINKSDFEKINKRLSELPFDSSRKLMSTINEYKGGKIAFVKGAVDVLISKCTKVLDNGSEKALGKGFLNSILAANSEMAGRALRVLGFAIKRLENGEKFDETNLTFVGMVGMIDPPRKGVKEAVEKCKSAGMLPVMITGDHKETAYAVAKEVGIVKSKKQVLTGAELDLLSDEQLVGKLDSVRVFARVSPEHKVRIVDAFKKPGHVVAMTGDGVNDAASMKKADIGIGMGITGTDITKQVADLMLTDDNFATIIIAVEEGRKVYKNIQKTVKFLFSANMGEILALFFATIIFPQYTFMLPAQILFINLITDSLPAIALGVEPAETDLMKQSPRPKDKGLFSDGNGVVVIVMGLVQTLLTLSAFVIGLYLYNEASGMSMAFYTLNIVQFFYLVSIRTEKVIFKSNPFKNKFIILAILFAGGLLTLIAATPLHKILGLATLNGWEWLYILLVSVVMLIASELCKWALRVHKRKLLKVK